MTVLTKKLQKVDRKGWRGWRVHHFCCEISSLPRHMAQGTLECQNHESAGPDSTASTHLAIVHAIPCIYSVFISFLIVLTQNNSVCCIKVE